MLIEYTVALTNDSDKIVSVRLYDYLHRSAMLKIAESRDHTNPHTNLHNTIPRELFVFDEIAAYAMYEGLVEVMSDPIPSWCCTHVLFDENKHYEVTLIDDRSERPSIIHNCDIDHCNGPAYTADEWYDTNGPWDANPADFEHNDGKWLFQGNPFTGKILPYSKESRRKAVHEVVKQALTGEFHYLTTPHSV